MRSAFLLGWASRRGQNLVLLFIFLVVVLVLDTRRQQQCLGGDEQGQLNKKLDLRERILRPPPKLRVGLGMTIGEEQKDGKRTLGRIHDNAYIGKLEAPNADAHIFMNISRLGKDRSLFAALPEEPEMAENRSVFSLNHLVKNKFDYDLFIDGANVCPDEDEVALLILIPSVPEDWRKRNAIRRTWLGAAERELWSHAKVGLPVRHVFLMGIKPFVDIDMLQAESRRHGDVVFAGFIDSYRNLTTKMLVGFQWAQNHCPQAQMLLKVDQDTLVNMPLMVALLQHIRWRARGDNAAFVLGLRHSYLKPTVRRTGKWRVSESQYPLPHFPAYLYGHTYAVSAPQGVRRLLQAARHVPLIAPEDAFITGILPKVTGVVRLTSRAFTVCCRAFISRCEVVWNEKVALTNLDSENLLDSVWADMMRQECDPGLGFKQNIK